MAILLYILVILHILTAASWFGLALSLTSRSRLVLQLEGTSARAAADDLTRTVRLMGLFIVLTFLFALGAFFLGGGFGRYGSPYHTSMLLIVLLLLVQYFLILPAANKLASVAESGGVTDATESYRKRLAMGLGIGQLLWVILLILMFGERLAASF